MGDPMGGLEKLLHRLTEAGFGERLLPGEPLCRHTSYAIGGPADVCLIARQLVEVRDYLRMARECCVPATVIGGGTNILVSDAGVRGLVILNECRGFHGDDSGLIIAESGVLLRDLARWSVDQSLQGLEWALGIPGTVGGAVVGNAGAYDGCIADTLCAVTLVRPNGDEERVPASSLAYGYRDSMLKRESRPGHRPIVLSAEFQLAPGDPVQLARRAQYVAERRKTRTPEGHSAGSVFKRTLQYPAGFLIDQAGLKGFRIGGAEVSCKHANFIINAGNATAADVRALIDKVREEVWSIFAQRLESEIELIGEWDR